MKFFIIILTILVIVSIGSNIFLFQKYSATQAGLSKTLKKTTSEVEQYKTDNNKLKEQVSEQDSQIIDQSITPADSPDVQSQIKDTMNQEFENQANCERNGGRYVGDNGCAYY